MTSNDELLSGLLVPIPTFPSIIKPLVGAELIPEYVDKINLVKNRYLYYNLIKYAILYKYGGFWINNDILMINNFEINQIDSHDIILYRMDKNNHLYLDDIIYVNRNNPIIKRVLDFIIYRLNTFQNTDIYFNSVVKYLNSILDSTVQIFFNNICLTHDLSGKKIDYKTYLSSFNN